MANALNRVTKQFKRSVNTPDYPEADWIINPDLSSVIGYPNKYWSIIGDVVSLLAQAERDAIDLAELEAGKDATANTIDTDPYLKAFALIMLDEINILRANDGLNPRTKAQLKTALRGKL